jgi:hypothetical protein
MRFFLFVFWNHFMRATLQAVDAQPADVVLDSLGFTALRAAGFLLVSHSSPPSLSTPSAGA